MDVEDGLKPGTTSATNAEVREAKKRTRLRGHESEVLRRAAAYFSQANLRLFLPGESAPRRLPKMTYPLVAELAEPGNPVTVSCRAL